jgi:hypothetical protein
MYLQWALTSLNKYCKLTTNRSFEIKRLNQKPKISSISPAKNPEPCISTTPIRQNENGHINAPYNQTIFQLGIGALVVRQMPNRRGKTCPSLEETIIQFRFADWFLRWAISIAICPEIENLKITIRTYCLVPSSSAIFQACALGDDQTVAQLIREGRASAFDMTSKGVTPLHVRQSKLTVRYECSLLVLNYCYCSTYLTCLFRWPPLGTIPVPANSFWNMAQIVRCWCNIVQSHG